MLPCSDKLLESCLCQFKMASCWLMHTQLGIVQEMWIFCWSVRHLGHQPLPAPPHFTLSLFPWGSYVVPCVFCCFVFSDSRSWLEGGGSGYSFPNPLRFCPVCFLLESFRPPGDSLREPPFPLSTELVC